MLLQARCLLMCPLPACGERATLSHQQSRLGEGLDLAPHPITRLEAQAKPSPRLRGEGAVTALALVAGV
jgi:hypothetical protein